MVLIKNGLVVDPANGIKRQADVLVKDGKIEWISGEDVKEVKDNTCDVIDATDRKSTRLNSSHRP